MKAAESESTIICEWCGSRVPASMARDVKPYRHPLTLCLGCCPKENHERP
jgi:hypothetical protein